MIRPAGWKALVLLSMGSLGTEDVRVREKAKCCMGRRTRGRRFGVHRMRVVVAEFDLDFVLAPAAALATGTYAPAGTSGIPH